MDKKKRNIFFPLPLLHLLNVFELFDFKFSSFNLFFVHFLLRLLDFGTFSLWPVLITFLFVYYLAFSVSFRIVLGPNENPYPYKRERERKKKENKMKGKLSQNENTAFDGNMATRIVSVLKIILFFLFVSFIIALLVCVHGSEEGNPATIELKIFNICPSKYVGRNGFSFCSIDA